MTNYPPTNYPPNQPTTSLPTRDEILRGYIHEGEEVVGKYTGIVSLTPHEAYYSLIDTQNQPRYFLSPTPFDVPLGQPLVITHGANGIEVKPTTLPNMVTYPVNPEDWTETRDQTGNIHAAHIDGNYLIIALPDRTQPYLFTKKSNPATGRLEWNSNPSTPLPEDCTTLDDAKRVISKRADYWRSVLCDCPVCAAKGRQGKIIERKLAFQCENSRDIQYGKSVPKERQCEMMPLFKTTRGATITRDLAKTIFETGTSPGMVRCLSRKGQPYDRYIIFDRTRGVIAFTSLQKPAGEIGLLIDPNGVPVELQQDFENFFARLQSRENRLAVVKNEIVSLLDEIHKCGDAKDLAQMDALRNRSMLAKSELEVLTADRTMLFNGCKIMSHCTCLAPGERVNGRLEDKIDAQTQCWAVIQDSNRHFRLVPWRDGMQNHMGGGIQVSRTDDDVLFIPNPIPVKTALDTSPPAPAATDSPPAGARQASSLPHSM